MSNPLKEAYDRASLLNDISERETLLQDYQKTGRLDRDKAVRKIQELRLTDSDVAQATAVMLAKSHTPFEQATDQAIANELQMQLQILSAKAFNKRFDSAQAVIQTTQNRS